jgi:hypothetical protein
MRRPRCSIVEEVHKVLLNEHGKTVSQMSGRQPGILCKCRYCLTTAAEEEGKDALL